MQRFLADDGAPLHYGVVLEAIKSAPHGASGIDLSHKLQIEPERVYAALAHLDAEDKITFLAQKKGFGWRLA